MTESGETSWGFLIVANVHMGVGVALSEARHDVVYVNEVFAQGVSDDAVDQYARSQGRIVVSHDKRFMHRIQQNMFQFEEPVGSGYGRIMLSGNEARQPDRLREILPLINTLLEWASANERRFLVTVGDTWIRYDDFPRTFKSQTEPPISE